MIYELNRSRVLKNINYLMKANNMKVGELEERADISTGLISRIAKEGSTVKMSVEFLASIAKVLGVSVDALIGIDFDGLTPSDTKLIEFLEKMTRKVEHDKILWDKETLNDLDNVRISADKSITSHPLFKVVEGFPGDYSAKYVSGFTKNGDAELCGPIYNYCLKDYFYVFLAQVRYDYGDEVQYEMYFSRRHPDNLAWYDTESVCCSKTNNVDNAFKIPLEALANAIIESDNHTKLSQEAWQAIHTFVDFDELTEEESGQLPF